MIFKDKNNLYNDITIYYDSFENHHYALLSKRNINIKTNIHDIIFHLSSINPPAKMFIIIGEIQREKIL